MGESNEITAIPRLLRILGLSGCIITRDAMGCRKNIAEGNGKASGEERYHLCSIGLGGKPFAKAVREHWGEENRCHWVLDAIFKDDGSRTRSPEPGNRAGWDNKYLEKVLTK